MARIDVKPPTLKKRLLTVLGVVVGVAALMLLGWGIGWTGHRMLAAYRRAEPTETVSVTAMLTDTPVVEPTVPPPTETPPDPPTEEPTPISTSTPLPTEAVSPTESAIEWTTVQQGEGLYQVCRRHCPGRWAPGSTPADLVSYARQVAEENELDWGTNGPSLSQGQELRMPACP
jgi:hypothetical protein